MLRNGCQSMVAIPELLVHLGLLIACMGTSADIVIEATVLSMSLQ